MTSGHRTQTVALFVGAAAGAGVLTTLNVPAGGIIGAVLGSATVSMFRERPSSTAPLRLAGLYLLGIASGLRLDSHTLAQLAALAVPFGVSLCVLVVVQILVAWTLTKLGIEPRTALLAAAPGGISEFSSLAADVRADVGAVTAIHIVRVIVVVLVALPLLIGVLH